MEDNKIVETQTNQNEDLQVKEVKQPTKNELLRELSKEHNVNLFDAEGIKQFKEYQESQKTKEEKMQEELNIYKTKEDEWDSKTFEYESKLAGLSLGINPDDLNDAVLLAKSKVKEDVDIKIALEGVLNKYPHFKTTKKDNQATIEIGGRHDLKPSNENGDSPFLAAFKKKRGIK